MHEMLIDVKTRYIFYVKMLARWKTNKGFGKPPFEFSRVFAFNKQTNKQADTKT